MFCFPKYDELKSSDDELVLETGVAEGGVSHCEFIPVSQFFKLFPSPDTDLSSMFSRLGHYKGNLRTPLALEDFEILFRWKSNMHETLSST